MALEERPEKKCCNLEKCGSLSASQTYYGENFILDQSEKRILYINENYDGEKPNFLEEISASNCEYVIYNDTSYIPHCYVADFSNDCLGLAEYITKGCSAKHKWSGECYLCEVDTKETIGYSDVSNVTITRKVHTELDMKKYKDTHIKPGNSVAVMETDDSVINYLDYPDKEIGPYHVAYIMFLDTVTYDRGLPTEASYDTYITVEANAFVERECPEFEVYLKYPIPRSMRKIMNDKPNIKTFEEDLIKSSTDIIGDGNFTEPKFIILTEEAKKNRRTRRTRRKRW